MIIYDIELKQNAKKYIFIYNRLRKDQHERKMKKQNELSLRSLEMEYDWVRKKDNPIQFQ